MLPNPPHNKNYNTLHRKNKTFISWQDMRHYQQKVTNLSTFLEKKEDLNLKKNYRKDLDTLLQIKTEKVKEDNKIPEMNKILKTQKLCNNYENKQENFQKKILLKN